jgi:hypothetical protein
VPELNERSRTMDKLTNQELVVGNAKAIFQNETLTREVAEIAVVEYEQGIFPQEEARIRGEVAYAEGELTRTDQQVAVAKERLAKIKGASKGSAADIALEYTYEDNIGDFERQHVRARLPLEVAQSKLKVLKDFTKEKTIKELKSGVEKAHSIELAAKAGWEVAKAELERINTILKSAAAKGSTGQLLSLLDRAFTLDVKIRAELGQLQKNETVDAGRGKAIEDPVSELEAVVDRADKGYAAARVDELKGAIRAAGVRP